MIENMKEHYKLELNKLRNKVLKIRKNLKLKEKWFPKKNLTKNHHKI